MSRPPKAPTFKQLQAEADASHEGLRLDRFLSKQLPQLSRTRVQNLIKQGRVSSGGATIVDAKYRVKPGERFALDLPPAAPPEPLAEAISLDVVYEDDALIVIDKPAGLVVHPGAGHPAGTLVNALIAHCGTSLSGIGGVKRPGIVHRLDKETSGLMVAAKTDKAHRALAEQFADHGRSGALVRSYQALVWGVPHPRKGKIDAALGRKPQQRQKIGVLAEGGKEAVTHFEVLETFGPAHALTASRMKCTLETGRTHQIRVHMAHIGHPLIGDPLYGSGFRTKAQALPEKSRKTVAELTRQALHACVLGFEHPESSEIMLFESKLPDDISRVITGLSES